MPKNAVDWTQRCGGLCCHHAWDFTLLEQVTGSELLVSPGGLFPDGHDRCNKEELSLSECGATSHQEQQIGSCRGTHVGFHQGPSLTPRGSSPWMPSSSSKFPHFGDCVFPYRPYPIIVYGW